MKEIELSVFIQNALVQIAKGVKDANSELRAEVYNIRQNKGDSANIPGVRFDVAVTAAAGQKDKAGFFVALVNVGAMAHTEKSREGEMMHRIQFEIGVEHTWR